MPRHAICICMYVYIYIYIEILCIYIYIYIYIYTYILDIPPSRDITSDVAAIWSRYQVERADHPAKLLPHHPVLPWHQEGEKRPGPGLGKLYPMDQIYGSVAWAGSQDLLSQWSRSPPPRPQWKTRELATYCGFLSQCWNKQRESLQTIVFLFQLWINKNPQYFASSAASPSPVPCITWYTTYMCVYICICLCIYIYIYIYTCIDDNTSYYHGSIVILVVTMQYAMT